MSAQTQSSPSYACQPLQVHTRNRPMADDVNLSQIAQDLPGLSGENPIVVASLVAWFLPGCCRLHTTHTYTVRVDLKARVLLRLPLISPYAMRIVCLLQEAVTESFAGYTHPALRNQGVVLQTNRLCCADTLLHAMSDEESPEHMFLADKPLFAALCMGPCFRIKHNLLCQLAFPVYEIFQVVGDILGY